MGESRARYRAGAACLAAFSGMHAGPAAAQLGPNGSAIVETIVFNAPTVSRRRTDTFSTRVTGTLQGGTIFDQVANAPFGDPAADALLSAARAAITTVGGPGVVIGAPVRIGRTETLTGTTVATLFSLDRTDIVATTRWHGLLPEPQPGTSPIIVDGITFHVFPDYDRIFVTPPEGKLACDTIIDTLPSATRPACPPDNRILVEIDPRRGPYLVGTGYVTFFVDETRTETDTYLITEEYELAGTVVAIGTVHAAVQSGLYDQASRLLRRLGDAGQASLIAAPQTGRGLWGEAYAMRVRHGDRRDTRGLAGGFSFGVGEEVTLGLGVDHGWIDIEMPGATETGDLRLTQLGAAARFDRGPFTAVLSGTYGFGSAETERLIVGASRADYDVRVAGAALDIGYAFQMSGWRITPVAGLDHVSVRSDAFTESDTLGLIAQRRRAGRTRASAGVEVGGGAGPVQLSASARYVTVLDGAERRLPVAFTLAPGSPLLMEGRSEPDAALLGARARLGLSSNAALTLGYDGRFGQGYDGHTAFVALGVAF